MIVFELIHEDLHRPCDLINLEQEMEIFFLVNSWEEKVQRVHLKELGTFQNLNLWVCESESLRGMSRVDVDINTPRITVSRQV